MFLRRNLYWGVASSVQGLQRLTQDVDALVTLSEKRWADAVAGAADYEIVPRIEGALEFARRSRVLLLHDCNTFENRHRRDRRQPWPLRHAAVSRRESLDIGGCAHSSARRSRICW